MNIFLKKSNTCNNISIQPPKNIQISIVKKKQNSSFVSSWHMNRTKQQQQ